MGDATARPMLTMKDTNKLFRNVLRALPEVRQLTRRKRTPILPFVLGAIGVAVAGGIAAVMVFSPRTRYRALDIAKDGYGKVRGQLDGLGLSEKLGIATDRNTTPTPQPYSNGLVNDQAGYSSSTSSGI
jgi:hypothetical protein